MNIEEFNLLDNYEREDLKKVLVIDDEVFILQIIEETIKSIEDSCCVTESNPKSGLACANEHKFDLILIDNIMPGMLGVDFIRSIRGSGGPNSDTPIMVVSASADRVEEEMKEFENVHYMLKPLKLPTLLGKLGEFLG